MSNSSSGSLSGTSTYATTQQTTQTTVVPSIITQSDQIAMYFANDLEVFVQHTHIDLAKEFQIPDEYPHDTKEIINMLYADISHMLRDGLITDIHLLLSDSEMDPGANAYLVRYHVRYTIHNPNVTFSTPLKEPIKPEEQELVMPPSDVWQNARFALLIDWSTASKGKRHLVRRPEYCFDWMPREERFNVTNVIRFRAGGLAVDSANVLRYEAAPPEHQRKI